MSICERLRIERERLQLSQTAFGEIVGVARNTVVLWEKGSAFPNAAALEKAADAGMDITYVVTGEKAMTGASEQLAFKEDTVAYEVKPKNGSQIDSRTEVPIENYASQMGARLLEERNRLGLSQEVLSMLCGVSREMLGKYERGQSVMSSEILFALSLSGVNVLYVLTGLKNENIAITRTELAYLRNCRALPNQAAREAGLNLLVTLRNAFEGKQ